MRKKLLKCLSLIRFLIFDKLKFKISRETIEKSFTFF